VGSGPDAVLLASYLADAMTANQVSTPANKLANDDPCCVEPM